MVRLHLDNVAKEMKRLKVNTIPKTIGMRQQCSVISMDIMFLVKLIRILRMPREHLREGSKKHPKHNSEGAPSWSNILVRANATQKNNK